MNKVILMGRLARDPESRMAGNNLEVTRFSIAVNAERANRNGERDAEFINCVSFGNTAGVINRYCRKGSQILVTGRIQNGSYEKDGVKRYTTDVVVESFEFAGSGSGSSSNGSSAQGSASSYDMPSFDTPSSNIQTTDVSSDPYKDFGDEITLSSDDLPF